MHEILYIEKEKLLPIIDAVVRKTMEMDLLWDWPCGVAYYGVCDAIKATENDEYFELLKNRIDEYIELGLPTAFTVNICAMGHSVLALHEKTGDEKYLDICNEKIAYLKKAPRFGESVIQHTVSSKNDFPEQAWADTLFMAALFMLKMGVKLKDETLINDALNQYYWHIEFLQDNSCGLWYHGYNNIEKSHMSGFYWGRANAWAAYTLSQVARVLPEPYLYPKFMDIAGSINEHLTALKALQTENGLWRTILDDPESYEEISASCGIAAAMAVRGNPLHRKYVKLALSGILANISENGRVQNVSGGTAIMRDRDGYRNISRKWTQGWGQGLALAFLSAIFQAEKFSGDGAL
ncbi:MAG: glycoside hydrolase family 88 protein [Defluviitaleaceae bacterium]|nr:glycoside hydrolase family 88 protein [Defluviitaleaceae bacterium]